MEEYKCCAPAVRHVLGQDVFQAYHRAVLNQMVLDQVVELRGKHYTRPELAVTEGQPESLRDRVVSLCCNLLDTYRKTRCAELVSTQDVQALVTTNNL